MKVTPTVGVGKAIKSRKLLLKFIRPYQVLRRIGPVANEITLPPQLGNLHNVFHVSQLTKYVSDLSHVLEVDDIQVKEDVTFEFFEQLLHEFRLVDIICVFFLLYL